MNPSFGLTPSGPIALPKSQVCDMVANSATFQAWIGAANQTAAYSKVFYTMARRTDDEHRSLRPYAVVMTTPELVYELDAGGLQNYLLPRGTVGVLISANDLYPEDITDSSLDFENNLGGVIQDVQNQAALNDNLAVIEVSLMAIRRLPEDDSLSQGCWWEGLFAVRWQA